MQMLARRAAFARQLIKAPCGQLIAGAQTFVARDERRPKRPTIRARRSA
jgi:hypothetical protein